MNWGFTSVSTATGHIRKRKDKKNGEKGAKIEKSGNKEREIE